MTKLPLPGPVVSYIRTIIGAMMPPIAWGNGAPTTRSPKGWLYLRQDGGVGSTLYVSQGAGTWNAVSGV